MRKMQVSSQKTATPATPNATKSADSEPDVEQAKPTAGNPPSAKDAKTSVKPKQTEQEISESVQREGKRMAEMSPQIGKQKMPRDSKANNIRSPQSHGETMTIRRSYGMIVSSYENVARKQLLEPEAAEQFGNAVHTRIRELTNETRKQIEGLPEYKRLDLDNINELGEELADFIRDEDDQLKAFALLKQPQFARLMESTESVHRSFAKMMEDQGEEHLLFGAIEMISQLGGLVGLQEETQQVAQQGSRINIKA
jgi:hypothetical protein